MENSRKDNLRNLEVTRKFFLPMSSEWIQHSMALEAQSAEQTDEEAEQTDILEAREWAYFLQKYQWFTFKTRDGLPYFMLSPYAYHKAMIFQPEATTINARNL